jgi:hypothetical protein
MKLFTVVPNDLVDPKLSAVFSTYKKAWEYVQRQSCIYQLQIFESEVIGDYEYPHEVFVLMKYPAFVLYADVEAVDIFATLPEDIGFAGGFDNSFEKHIPDAKETVTTYHDFVIAKIDLTTEAKETWREIEKVMQDIDACEDLRKQQRLKRVLRELQAKQLLQIRILERL